MRRGICLVHLTTGILFVMLVLILIVFTGPTRGELIAMDALSHLDAQYVYGESGPETFDCSGLILHSFALQGFDMPHSAEKIGSGENSIAIPYPWMLQVGDIVCFDTVQDSDPSDHVGIWLGGNRFVHASSAQGKVVISELKDFYLERYTGARRYMCSLF